MSTHTKQFNILLSARDRAKLDAISEHNHCTNAVTLRQLVINAHLHIIAGFPTCPTGQPCFNPNLHPRRQQPPPKEPT